MRLINRFLIEKMHFLWVLALLPLLFWFKYLELTVIPRYITHSVIDDHIPFLKIFVVPYIIWFFYITYGVIFTGLHDKKAFYRLLIHLGAGMGIAYTIYMIFPNGVDLRPIITKNDVFSNLVKYIYATDTSTNVCPSVHVINSMAVTSALLNSKDFGTKRSLTIGAFILNVLICLSTVFIKQHSIIDVVCGLIVSSVLYILIYYLPSLDLINGSKQHIS